MPPPATRPGPIAAIVFDFDGVIVDSEEAKTAAFDEAFSRFPEHLERMRTFHLDHRSLPRRRKLERLAELVGSADPVSIVEELELSFRNALERRMDDAPFVPGARELILELCRSLPLYVASVTPEAELMRALRRRRIAHCFLAAFGDPPTPKRTAIRRVVSAVGGDPSRVVLIGDSPSDLEAAAAAGVRFIGRDSGMTFPPDAPVLHRDLWDVGAELRELFDA